MGENRRLLGAAYGNAVLSRFPLHSSLNYDLSVGGRESRGCFRTEVLYGPTCRLQVFNVHLGTGFFERRRQAHILLRQLSANKGTHAPRVILGDFNEWTKGLTSRLLAGHLRTADVRAHLNWRRTYPGLFPVLHLDHVYYDPALHLESLKLDRSAAALMASDHLPLVANFQIAAGPSCGKMLKMTGSNLYQAIGGTAGCRALSVAFYAHVARDPVLRPLFPGKSLRCAVEEFAAFLVHFLGGPADDAQFRWWLSLRESHLRLKIGPRERSAWMANMRLALDDVRFEEPLRSVLLGFFERSSAHVVNQGEASARRRRTLRRRPPAACARRSPAGGTRRPAWTRRGRNRKRRHEACRRVSGSSGRRDLWPIGPCRFARADGPIRTKRVARLRACEAERRSDSRAGTLCGTHPVARRGRGGKSGSWWSFSWASVSTRTCWTADATLRSIPWAMSARSKGRQAWFARWHGRSRCRCQRRRQALHRPSHGGPPGQRRRCPQLSWIVVPHLRRGTVPARHRCGVRSTAIRSRWPPYSSPGARTSIQQEARASRRFLRQEAPL